VEVNGRLVDHARMWGFERQAVVEAGQAAVEAFIEVNDCAVTPVIRLESRQMTLPDERTLSRLLMLRWQPRELGPPRP
jgi:hypothetical protein